MGCDNDDSNDEEDRIIMGLDNESDDQDNDIKDKLCDDVQTPLERYIMKSEDINMGRGKTYVLKRQTYVLKHKTYVLKCKTYVLKLHAASLNANGNIHIMSIYNTF
jgi:hypothetical protein